MSDSGGVRGEAAGEFRWVLVESVFSGQVKSLQGRVATADLEAVLSGRFPARFLRLEDVHWQQEEWRPSAGGASHAVVRRPEQGGQGGGRFERVYRTEVAGRAGMREHYTGTYHLPVAGIILIAELVGPATGFYDLRAVQRPVTGPDHVADRDIMPKAAEAAEAPEGAPEVPEARE